MIAVAGETPVLRRRIEMVRAAGFRANQPYHAAAEMPPDQAEPFLRRIEAAAVEMAVAQIADAVNALAARGYQAGPAAVLLGSGRPLPELAKILAAHPLIHTAEGVFFREVLISACRKCGLDCRGIKEQDVPPDLLARVSGLGKALGPPWTQDEKLSTAAAILAAGRARRAHGK